MNHELLVYMKEKIEAMDTTYHIELANLLKQHGIPFNKNKNGKFYNISLVSSEVVQAIDEFIKHVELQEQTLVETEQKKDALKDVYFK
jgi:hypothetical protein